MKTNTVKEINKELDIKTDIALNYKFAFEAWHKDPKLENRDTQAAVSKAVHSIAKIYNMDKEMAADYFMDGYVLYERIYR